MKKIFFILIVSAAALGVLFFLTPSVARYTASVSDASPSSDSAQSHKPSEIAGETTQKPSANNTQAVSGDEPNQPKLANPPTVVRALYVTGWVAGISSRVEGLLALAKKNNINAFVVDIKDYSGYLSYCPQDPEIEKSGACDQPRLAKPNALIKKLHENNIYVIGRVSVFQDPIQAKAHPEWAIHDAKTGSVWRDRKGLAWLEVAAPEVTDYVARIAKDATERGFDEINFDYVRFPSDGDLDRAVYAHWDKKSPRSSVVAKFFRDIREKTSGITISADLFGLTTVQTDDLGIGQIIEDAYPNFDFIYPMVYPSHYAAGFLNYKNPADHPYEVIHYSMETAVRRKTQLALNNGNSTIAQSTKNDKTNQTQQAALDATQATKTTDAPLAKLRPWLQVFDLGAVYTQAMVEAQVKATTDALHGDEYAGWLLWDPKVTYTPLK